MEVQRAAPPEWWEELAERMQAWVTDPSRVAKIVRIRSITMWGSLGVVALALLVMPEFRTAARVGFIGLLSLVILFFLCRTKTVRWRSVSALFAVGGMWSFIVVGLSFLAAALGDLAVDSEGSVIAIAGLFEEALKLTPLLVIATIAPGRARRFSAIDWLLLGAASATGFEAAEEGAREMLFSLRNPGGLEVLFGISADRGSRQGGLNPFTSGFFERGDGAAAGHVVWTMIVAGCFGLAVALWHRRGTATSTPNFAMRRVLPGVLVLVAFLLVVSVHAGFNASLQASNFWVGEGYPSLWRWFWVLSNNGRWLIAMSVIVWLACLLVDTARRRDVLRTEGHASEPGQAVSVYDELGWDATCRDGVAKTLRPGGEPSGMVLRLANVAGLFGLLVASTVNEFSALRAYGRSEGESVPAAVARGRQATESARAFRESIAHRFQPGAEPATRNRFRGSVIAFGFPATAFCLVFGLLIAMAIGPDLADPLDGSGPLSYFASIFEALGEWWGELPFWKQFLFMLAAAAFLGLIFGSFGWAFWGVGIAGYLLDHHKGVMAFADDPSGATKSYLQTSTPQDFVLDLIEAGLTFIPAGLGAKAGTTGRGAIGKPARSTPGRAGEVVDDAARVPGASTIPDIPVRRPNNRHFLDHIDQSTVAKNQNTVVESGVDVADDLAKINRGEAVLDNGEYAVNGRRYGVHENGRSYPISGDGLHQLTRQEFKILQTLQGVDDLDQARQIVVRAFGATPETLNKIEAIIATGS